MSRSIFDPPPQGRSATRTQSVDELSSAIKTAITTNPLFRNIAVLGELQGFKRHSSGHVYFTLLGRDSRISAVLFRSHSSSVLVWPQEGDEVVVTGSVDVYPKSGAYQLYATRIMPVGAGAQARAKEQLKAQLEKEGLFDRRHKRAIPPYPSKVAVITSPTGAAVRDILAVSLKRAPAVDIVIIPAVVQGVDAPADIAAAFAALNSLTDVDSVILGRGGGARDDLSPFDDERIVRAVRGCPIPVVTGIGHEIDASLADLAADLTMPTPSAAAEAVFPQKTEIAANLAYSRQFMAGVVLGAVERRALLLDRLEKRSRELLCHKLAECGGYLDRSLKELKSSLTLRIDRQEERLAHAASQLDVLSPLSILSRGYSICTDRDNRVICDSAELESGGKINLRFAVGSAEAEVTSVSRPD